MSRAIHRHLPAFRLSLLSEGSPAPSSHNVLDSRSRRSHATGADEWTSRCVVVADVARARSLQEVDRKAAAVLPPPFSRDAASGVLDLGHIPKEAVFIAHQPQFKSILGPSPKLSLIAEEGWACFHEAGIYDPHRGSIFITSNRITGEQHENQHIAVTEVPLADPSARKQLSPSEHGVVMANGGTNYKDGYLFCDQGYGESQPSSLVFVAPSKDGHSLDSQVILNNYHGRPFNSLNDVVVHRDGSIWFTDPDCEHRLHAVRCPLVVRD